MITGMGFKCAMHETKRQERVLWDTCFYVLEIHVKLLNQIVAVALSLLLLAPLL
jgi:hypothetical protein